MAQNNSRLTTFFISGLFLIALAMIAVIYVATRRPVVVVVPQAGATSNLPAIADGAPAAASQAATPLPEISLVKLDNVPPIDNPLDPAWDQIVEVEIPLDMQQTAAPLLETRSVANIKLQTAHDSERYVWRLSWEQAEPSYRSNVAEFSDAVAIQFPLVDGAPYTMGGPDMPVAMMYWKALWQKDIDEGFQDVTDVYPNSWYDLYWFSKETGPVSVEKLSENKPACQYMAGISTGNSMSTIDRKQPVQELCAFGFGSSTDVPNSPVAAKGTWQDGRWYVVFERPNDKVDPVIARFAENPQQQMLALAVWDGVAENRGGRKHITNWIPMKVEP